MVVVRRGGDWRLALGFQIRGYKMLPALGGGFAFFQQQLLLLIGNHLQGLYHPLFQVLKGQIVDRELKPLLAKKTKLNEVPNPFTYVHIHSSDNPCEVVHVRVGTVDCSKPGQNCHQGDSDNSNSTKKGNS